jgi:hypothetical protein
MVFHVSELAFRAKRQFFDLCTSNRYDNNMNMRYERGKINENYGFFE